MLCRASDCRMKLSKLSSVLALVVLSQLAVSALAVEKLEWNTRKSPSQIIDILKDVEHTCESGCRLTAPRVIRQGSIRGRNTNSMFYWTHINAPFGTYLFFNHLKVTEGEGSTVVEIAKVNNETQIASLEQASGKEHDPGPLLNSKVKLTLTQEGAVTKVAAELTVSTSMGNGIAQRSLRDAAQALKSNTQ